MKKIISIICTIAITAATPLLLTSCSGIKAEQEDKIKIVSTIFPIYDWTRQIIGEDNMDKFELTLLINSGIDMHSYNPSVQEVLAIKNCDVFIYPGGHSDNWVGDIMADVERDITMINLLEILGDDMLIAGGGCGEDCDEDHDHQEDSDDDVPDEHIWFSLRCAAVVCEAIADMLVQVEPDNAQSYRENLVSYSAVLSELDSRYQAAADNANTKTLVVADRFPFRYMANDYGIQYYAAFDGCSAESEASFVTITSLATRINQLGLTAVVVTETSDKKIAETVISSTNDKNQRILVLDSMHMSNEDTATYISIMKSNLDALSDALSY